MYKAMLDSFGIACYFYMKKKVGKWVWKRGGRKGEGMCEIEKDDDRIITGLKKKDNEGSRIICDDFRELDIINVNHICYMDHVIV